MGGLCRRITTDETSTGGNTGAQDGLVTRGASAAACSKYRAWVGNCQPSLQFANISPWLLTPAHRGFRLRQWDSALRCGAPGSATSFHWIEPWPTGSGDRRFPDGRVSRACSRDGGATISAIGREIGITRQGASKVVTHLNDRGYVVVADSTTSKREKSVVLTSRGADYLKRQSAAARKFQDELRSELGDPTFSVLCGCLTRWMWGTKCAFGRTLVVRRASSGSPL